MIVVIIETNQKKGRKRMKKAISVLLCAVMVFAAVPLSTAGAADAETETSCTAFMQSATGENDQTSFAQYSVLDLILEDYAAAFTFDPESMDEVIEDVKGWFQGFFIISAFGGFLCVPLLMPVVFLRFVIGTCKVIAAGFYILSDGVIHAHLSGTLKEYIHLSPAYIVKYATALWGKEHGFRLVHYGGGTSRDPENSLYLFLIANENGINKILCVDDRFERMRVVSADERDGAALTGLYTGNELIECFDSHRNNTSLI